jgi:AcrR family transcriptional regulator
MSESPTRIVTVDGRKRRPWALASQEKLLQAATDEIAAVGFERARLTEIAKRAGLTPGSVYTWFKNKEDLFRAAIEHALTKQIESNAHVLDTHKINDVASWLVQIAGLVPRNIKDSGPTATQKLLIEAYYASWRDPKARKKLLPRIREHYDMYERIVVAAQAKGAIDKSYDAHLIAMILLAIPTGMAMLSLAGLERPDDMSWIAVYDALGRTLS